MVDTGRDGVVRVNSRQEISRDQLGALVNELEVMIERRGEGEVPTKIQSKLRKYQQRSKEGLDHVVRWV